MSLCIAQQYKSRAGRAAFGSGSRDSIVCVGDEFVKYNP